MDDGELSSSLEILEKDYQETLSLLTGSKAQVAEAFRVEYEKLFKALTSSHEQEKRLTKKIRDLNKEISDSAQSVQQATRAALDDQNQIVLLRQEIEAHQKLVDECLAKERVAEESVQKHKAEVHDLMVKIEDQGTGLNSEQKALVSQLENKKETLQKESELLKANIDMLSGICAETVERAQKAEAARAESEEKIIEIKQSVSERVTESETEKRRKEELEEQMKDLRLQADQSAEELNLVQRNIANEEADLKKIKKEVEEIKQEEERLGRLMNQRIDEKKKLDDKLEQELSKNQKYVQENEQRELVLRRRNDEIQQHNTEREKVQKMHEALKKKERSLDTERQDTEATRNELKSELKTVQEKMDSLRRESDGDRKKIEDILRERDILNKNVIKADDRTKKQIDLVKRQETQALNMQKDIARWKQDAQEFKKRIYELEKQREKYGVELSQANAKYFVAQEELRERAARLADLEKQITNVQAKRNQQKNLYDAVCMDRNAHTKALAESNEQKAEMRRKFRDIFHHTKAFKEEIRDKDHRLVQDHFHYKKVLQLNEKLKDSLDKAQRRMRNLVNIVETQRTQMKKLEGTIQEAEQERQAQQKELEGVIGERDILGAQLIHRNEELVLLYEKIKIQQSTLQKGEIQYQERVNEVNALRDEIRETKSKVAVARGQVVNVDHLKREIHFLNKTLLREEAKAKALQEELENPMNVHRWRELEGSDPATYEMIQKVKNLQRQLIAKTEEVVEQDQRIQEKEKLYVQLKNIIARQPGPEVAEQLAWYSQNLKEKTAHMKQMAAELEMYHDQVKDLRAEIEMHSKDLAISKQTYFQRLRQHRAQFQH